MEPHPSLPELVSAAQATAKPLEDRIAELQILSDSDSAKHDLNTAIAALEATAVDLYSVFEARMQHHFRRGPFSRKLKALLLANDNPDLANRLHHYYLAINVLKHGSGASYRELLETPTGLFAVKSPDKNPDTTTSLVDITAPGFFDGLSATILAATEFLENRPAA